MTSIFKKINDRQKLGGDLSSISSPASPSSISASPSSISASTSTSSTSTSTYNKDYISNDGLKQKQFKFTFKKQVDNLPVENVPVKKGNNLFGTRAPIKKFNIKSTLWCEKYRPNKLEDIIGNNQQILTISNWLKLYDEKTDPSMKRALLLSGPPGTSKTTCAKILLEHFGYKVLNFNASDLRTKLLVENNISEIININTTVKYAIIMNEVDGMSTGENGGLSQLVKIITNDTKTVADEVVKKRGKNKVAVETKWNFPIICVSNYISDSKFDNLIKNCIVVKFNNICDEHLDIVIKNICKKENISISDDAKESLIVNSQGDFRRCINLLQTYSQHNGKFIDMDIIRMYNSIILSRSVEANYYETTKKIFLSKDYGEILEMFEHKKNFIPMMIHENYPNYIKESRLDNKEALKRCYNSISSICNGDITEKTILNIQNWNLQTIHGITSSCIPKYYSTNFKFKRISGLISIIWPKVFLKYSLFKSSIKNIHEIYNVFFTNNYYSYNDIHTLSTYILYNILNNNEANVRFGFKILNYYNIPIDYLEKLIKMNKLSTDLKNYKSKPKIKELYNSIYGNDIQREINTTLYNGTKKNDLSDNEDE